MKNLSIRQLSVWLFVAAATLSVLQLEAYDAPDFSKPLFDADGLFLGDTTRDSLLEALAAIGANFPKDSRVDDDLREKALAVSLGISPLHYNSRAAHEALESGKQPSATDFFNDPAGVSETLWSTAERLAGAEAEPENEKLAGYLMEISLLLHPSPPKDRVQRYLSVIGQNRNKWGQSLTLQPDANPSSKKAGELLRMEMAGATDNRERPGGLNPFSEPEQTEMRSEGIQLGDDVALEVQEVSFPFVSTLQNREEYNAARGVASLIVRDPKPEEKELFSQSSPENPGWAEQMQLVPNPLGVSPSGMRSIFSISRGLHPVWPMGRIGEIGFSTEKDLGAAQSITQADLSLAGTLLLHRAFTGKELKPDIVFCGSLSVDEDSGEVSLETGGDLVKIVEAARGGGEPFLVVPESAFDELLRFVTESGQLEILFGPQLLSSSSLGDALYLAFDEDASDRSEVEQSFKEIEVVSSRMKLVDLARNAKVQERLESILSRYPRHLSARVMLAYGKGETPAG